LTTLLGYGILRSVFGCELQLFSEMFCGKAVLTSPITCYIPYCCQHRNQGNDKLMLFASTDDAMPGEP
jgi:hypothetical protein